MKFFTFSQFAMVLLLSNPLFVAAQDAQARTPIMGRFAIKNEAVADKWSSISLTDAGTKIGDYVIVEDGSFSTDTTSVTVGASMFNTATDKVSSKLSELASYVLTQNPGAVVKPLQSLGSDVAYFTWIDAKKGDHLVLIHRMPGFGVAYEVFRADGNGKTDLVKEVVELANSVFVKAFPVVTK
ncbi:MAG: hypothetical protein RLZZ324_410 [Candidatus Parcubacteria bacterium]|jgi:hypothetical protein